MKEQILNKVKSIKDVQSLVSYKKRLWVHRKDGSLQEVLDTNELQDFLTDIYSYELKDDYILYQTSNLSKLYKTNISGGDSFIAEGEFSLRGANVIGDFHICVLAKMNNSKVISILDNSLNKLNDFRYESFPIVELEIGSILYKNGKFELKDLHTNITKWSYELPEGHKFQKYPNQYFLSGDTLIANIKEKGYPDFQHSLVALDLKTGKIKWFINNIPWLFFFNELKNQIFLIDNRGIKEINPLNGKETNFLDFGFETNVLIPSTFIDDEHINVFCRNESEGINDKIITISLSNMSIDRLFVLDSDKHYNFDTPILHRNRIYLFETYLNEVFIYE